MTFDIPDDRKYQESHEWARSADGTAKIGITDFAQDELGDIVFVELPAVGDDVSQGAEFGVVESIKAVSDLYAPVSGTVTAVNEQVFDAPELVNDDPYGEGWMLELELADESELDSLLTPEAYADQIA
ncbi:glycine cleavage system protein GcvH [Haladaptatus sp. DJG-WS-42]|uniref:glycine cleavage system protein GcvH n=1 Tax=Haladaptatus sp. DJG-WS-42 TaxID=3120516 RepID=UPI0030CE9DE2